MHVPGVSQELALNLTFGHRGACEGGSCLVTRHGGAAPGRMALPLTRLKLMA